MEICRDENVPDDKKAKSCDDGPFGKGAGGQLRYGPYLVSGEWLLSHRVLARLVVLIPIYHWMDRL